MRLFQVILCIAVFCLSAWAAAQQKAVIISYPEETPHSVLEAAMEIIEKAGGVITHEYTIFKGFAATTSATALETLKALGDTYIPVIEEDSIVSISGDIQNSPKMH